MRHTFLFCSFILLFACNQASDPLNNLKIPPGGYNYPSGSVDSQFFFHPLNEKFTRQDSFKFAWYGVQVMNAFHEPNLSIGPRSSTIMRVTWEGGSLGSTWPVVIVVRRNEIELKEGLSGHLYLVEDTSRLNDKERLEFNLLENFYPLNSSEHKPWRRKYLDSIVKRTPKLLSPDYYMLLKQKSAVDLKPFRYKYTRIRLDDKDYLNLLQLINSSGFWSMPYMPDCPSVPTDAGGFIFEVNTPKKYNMVWVAECPGDTSNFRKACQKIVELAGMQKKINLIWR